MTDERDPKVSQRYRNLPGEEPPRELDQAILAAAHRATDKAHAPLVVPAGRHRWYFSLGAVAILVLAVAVTVQVERQQPDPELTAPQAEPAPAAKAEPRLQRSPAFAPNPAAPKPAAPAPAPELRKERAAGDLAANRAAPSPSASSPAVTAQYATVTPEQELERIAELRRQGRDEEADKALAEFRKRYPDYRMEEAMRQKVERRTGAAR